MAAKGIKKKIAIARANAEKEIRSNSRQDGSTRERFFARGMAGEGFNGGYMAALDDVLLALNGVQPQRNHWWEE